MPPGQALRRRRRGARGGGGEPRAAAAPLRPARPAPKLTSPASPQAEFKALGEALEVLDDDFKRKLYNEGYDKAAIEERVQAADRAAKNHSKDGCCGGGCH